MENKKDLSVNQCTYEDEMFAADCEEFATAANVPTGYENLDRMTNLYPGFYIIGATTSLGKTTFIHQMCDQLAKSGQHIIYFSLEMDRKELTAKSLARIIAQKDIENPYEDNTLSALEIMKHVKDERVIEALKEHKQYSSNISIVDNSSIINISDIEDVVNNYVRTEKIKPIVVVDYLQIIGMDKSSGNSKIDIDNIVRRLKLLQQNNSIALIVISSFNRQNYMNEIAFDSFKESGGIEYTANVLWGLQLDIIHNEEFQSADINKKREMFKAAKLEIPRKIELVCLKDRFGASSYSANFLYYPANDLYVPDEGFAHIPDGIQMDIPF